MIDVVQTINAVQRQVGSRTLEAGEARTTTISRAYDAGLEDLRRATRRFWAEYVAPVLDGTGG